VVFSVVVFFPAAPRGLLSFLLFASVPHPPLSQPRTLIFSPPFFLELLFDGVGAVFSGSLGASSRLARAVPFGLVPSPFSPTGQPAFRAPFVQGAIPRFSGRPANGVFERPIFFFGLPRFPGWRIACPDPSFPFKLQYSKIVFLVFRSFFFCDSRELPFPLIFLIFPWFELFF